MSDQEQRPLDSMGVPREPIDRIVKPITRFLHVETAGGFVLLGCTVIALALANSAWSEQYLAIWKTQVGFSIGSFEMFHSLKHWINDGLMALFFFVIGLEVKRELVLGELRDMRRAALPLAAALGGMIVPAALYLLFLGDNDGVRGWGIPMATDIAFVVGCMALLGSRVPHILRVTILSLAIADDIGAILVIAIGYTDEVGLGALLFGFAGIGVCSLLARLGVRRTGVYVVVGISRGSVFTSPAYTPRSLECCSGCSRRRARGRTAAPWVLRCNKRASSSRETGSIRPSTRPRTCGGWNRPRARHCHRSSGWSRSCTRGRVSSSCRSSRFVTPRCRSRSPIWAPPSRSRSSAAS